MLKRSEVKSQISKGGAVGSDNPFLLCIVAWTLRSYVRQTVNRSYPQVGDPEPGREKGSRIPDTKGNRQSSTSEERMWTQQRDGSWRHPFVGAVSIDAL